MSTCRSICSGGRCRAATGCAVEYTGEARGDNVLHTQRSRLTLSPLTTIAGACGVEWFPVVPVGDLNPSPGVVDAPRELFEDDAGNET